MVNSEQKILDFDQPQGLHGRNRFYRDDIHFFLVCSVSPIPDYIPPIVVLVGADGGLKREDQRVDL